MNATNRKAMPLAMRRHMQKVLHEIERERHKQHAKWGAQLVPSIVQGAREWWREFGMSADLARQACENASKVGDGNFLSILFEEVCEAFDEACTLEPLREPESRKAAEARLRKELVQVAAVCVKWIEQIDSGKQPDGSHVRHVPIDESRIIIDRIDSAIGREIRDCFLDKRTWFDVYGRGWSVGSYTITGDVGSYTVTGDSVLMFEAAMRRAP